MGDYIAKNENNFETLDKVANGLYATPTTELPFDKRFRFKSFVLERSEGNIVIFHSGRIDEAADDIQSLGGADRVLMNHEHESLGGQTHFDAPYYIHQDDKEAVTDTLQVAGTFKDREQLYDDLEVIPAPGHTPGTTLYLWDNGEHRYLFTGDFLCYEGDEWRTVVLPSSDREQSIKSLEMIRDLDFDALVPWVSIEGESPVFFINDDNDKQQRVQKIIDRVRNGENT
ncbi:MBL fold metallo-hydrolase [Staphylococcus caprae]|uniref:MBL fold metallo-hydrolase n=1 Tax=Staphylococcus caprae TaxID=29380 RepID=UPI002174DCA0|nr:MBL fold metallo-hydrolase [Staphylococcus caprae]MDK6298216.1 MBL fold metallo-hydrolase [Staphylococcus caprae]MDK7232294.1 MBL fold metallo-hydrolase [Staphylococcus caprae]